MCDNILYCAVIQTKQTGNSKGYAFVEFQHEEVAKVVAETMDNYLMFDKLLKCKESECVYFL